MLAGAPPCPAATAGVPPNPPHLQTPSGSRLRISPPHGPDLRSGETSFVSGAVAGSRGHARRSGKSFVLRIRGRPSRGPLLEHVTAFYRFPSSLKRCFTCT